MVSSILTIPLLQLDYSLTYCERIVKMDTNTTINFIQANLSLYYTPLKEITKVSDIIIKIYEN